jgi:hypothetical protein
MATLVQRLRPSGGGITGSAEILADCDGAMPGFVMLAD